LLLRNTSPSRRSTLHGHFSRCVCGIAHSGDQELTQTSAAILVGEAQSWLPELVERAQKMNVNGGFEKDADL
jgi:hypothetical protein